MNFGCFETGCFGFGCAGAGQIGFLDFITGGFDTGRFGGLPKLIFLQVYNVDNF
jgi:hypothetical protein